MAVNTDAIPARPPWYQGRYASWLVTTDHKRVGILYVSTSLLFFLGGGVLALLMRSQLATANEHFIVRGSYDELFTLHGTVMVFLVTVPILAGLGNFLVPLMIGARDVAFPRLNAMSYWFFLFGGLTLFLSFFASGGAAKCGWTCYAPLSETAYSPGHGVDLWIFHPPAAAGSRTIGRAHKRSEIPGKDGALLSASGTKRTSLSCTAHVRYWGQSGHCEPRAWSALERPRTFSGPARLSSR